MATVPMGYLRALSDAIDGLSAEAKEVARAVMEAVIGTTDDPMAVAGAVAEALEPYFEALAAGAASASANAYDLIRMAAVGDAYGAVPYADRDAGWTRDALYAIAKAHDGDVAGFVAGVLDRMDYEAKRAAGTTMFANGFDDPAKPRFARVPTGPETCPFCIMLASRGFVYASARSAGKLDHYHPNCDCRVAVGFPGATYEGYDPDEYLQEYERMLDDGRLRPDALAASARRSRLAERIDKGGPVSPA